MSRILWFVELQKLYWHISRTEMLTHLYNVQLKLEPTNIRLDW